MIHVAVHPSQYPDQVRADLLKSLQSRQVRHKFHYDTYKQARKWLAVHEKHSPARNDAACRGIYDEAFEWLAGKFEGATIHVIGLGCGGGQKDVALLETIKQAGGEPAYTAVDVSLPLVITARLRAQPFAQSTTGLVCDLETAGDIRDEVCDCSAGQRAFTFFGMIPNSEPEIILPRLRKLFGRGDIMLLSANLAPGADYRAGVARILPQYDNPETADWLLTFLYDLGVERDDGALTFSIEEASMQLLRVRADFQFSRDRAIRIENDRIEFHGGDQVRFFFSYRYTPERLAAALQKYDLQVLEQWIAPSGEEGVFAVTNIS